MFSEGNLSSLVTCKEEMSTVMRGFRIQSYFHTVDAGYSTKC